MKRFRKSLSCILCIVLIAAMALFTTGCSDNKKNNSSKTPDTTQSGTSPTEKATDSDAESSDESETTPTPSETEDNVLGEGETVFYFTVTDKDGAETEFEIHTDKKIVGEALLDANLIAGEEGDYGLYVKTVNGTTLDYDTDGMYWAFYIDGEYAMTGVDSTEITDGETYSFKAEK